MKVNPFLESFSSEIMPQCPAILGCPLDLTSTYRSGSSRGPSSIRVASDSIESYSPLLDRDLLESPFADLGDLTLSDKSFELCLERIRRRVFEMVQRGANPLCIGGEHTITLPIVRAIKAFYPALFVVHADAHTDLRDQYQGSFINHATVMRRVHEIIGSDRVIQLGVRSGTRDEFVWMHEKRTLLHWEPAAEKILLERVRGRPVYLTVDLDVLDPSCLPGTGNPEPGGWSYRDLERLICAMDQVNLVGADVVELNPDLDQSGVSSITAAKIVRELVLVLSEGISRKGSAK